MALGLHKSTLMVAMALALSGCGPAVRAKTIGGMHFVCQVSSDGDVYVDDGKYFFEGLLFETPLGTRFDPKKECLH